RAFVSRMELVVLVDEGNNVVGTMPKGEVHQARTPLHRAFSSFIFRDRDRHLLLQQRSRTKRTWPLMWSNSCCGHPGPGESNLEAARRRLRYELALEPTVLEEVAPYRYCLPRDGHTEKGVCPTPGGPGRPRPPPQSRRGRGGALDSVGGVSRGDRPASRAVLGVVHRGGAHPREHPAVSRDPAPLLAEGGDTHEPRIVEDISRRWPH